ncbi:MAG: T9SS type A sorting domain-containing protein [Saprospiraceae bacterium]|nr:T9SS type A sorting domain-containing protein [Saprospiraceae bacterium]
MKKYLSLGIVLCLLSFQSSAQTLIGTSTHPDATANHNQRKIVRDSINNIYVIWVDSLNQETTIFGQKFTNTGTPTNLVGSWGTATSIVAGNNPTLSISKDNKIHLVYESNDSLSQIRHRSTIDFSNWSVDLTISDNNKKHTKPCADINDTGELNVFWIQKETNTQSLVYAYMQADTLVATSIIMNKPSIEDLAVANHLQYFTNTLFLGVQYSQDSLIFIKSQNQMVAYDTLIEVRGSQPCISANSNLSSYTNGSLLYVNLNGELIERYYSSSSILSSKVLSTGIVDYVAINNIVPELGYSFLYQKNDTLYHTFSHIYGSVASLDTIATNPIHASIGYKHYNERFVDFIWMEDAVNGYNIYYKRDGKPDIPQHTDRIENKLNLVVDAYPNPFSDKLIIRLLTEVDHKKDLVTLKVYSLNAEFIKELKAIDINNSSHRFEWLGKDSYGQNVPNGMYILTAKIGTGKITKKIILSR